MTESVYNTSNKDNSGVTFVELILVVALIGILATVSISVINVQRQRQVAEEASLRANMLKVCAAIEAYYEGENETYPGEGVAPANRNPLDASAPNDDVLAFYLQRWPSDEFVYNSTGTTFSVHVKQSVADDFYKCNYDWKNVRECASTMDEEDPDSCP